MKRIRLSLLATIATTAVIFAASGSEGTSQSLKDGVPTIGSQSIKQMILVKTDRATLWQAEKAISVDHATTMTVKSIVATTGKVQYLLIADSTSNGADVKKKSGKLQMGAVGKIASGAGGGNMMKTLYSHSDKAAVNLLSYRHVSAAA